VSLDKKIKILKDALSREKEARRILEDELERKTRTVYEAYESVNNIIQVMGESLIVIDLDGIIKKVNLATIDLLHYSEEELLGKDIGIIIGEAVNIRTLINESPTVSVERTYLTNDGIKIPVLFSSTSLRDLSGKSNGAVCVARDISESKRTAKALQESEKRFKDIAYSMADWIWEVDKQARYTFSSTAARKILGYDPEEIIGKRPFDLMPPEEAERIKQIFLKIVSEKKPIVDLENWNLNKQGEKVCLLTNGVPLPWPVPGATSGWLRSCSWIWTASRTSTTPWATPWAICC
jgi:PAS domain S-box-containing protein